MDYQINNIMGKIDNLLEDPNYGDRWLYCSFHIFEERHAYCVL